MDTTPKKSLMQVYQEASQWVRLTNTIIWSMGTVLVPVSFGFVGLALNKYKEAQFSLVGKAILGVGSIFLFSFWVFASRIYRLSTQAAREVLEKVEKEWGLPDEVSLYKLQRPILGRHKKILFLNFPLGLFPLQISALVGLICVWILILFLRL